MDTAYVREFTHPENSQESGFLSRKLKIFEGMMSVTQKSEMLGVVFIAIGEK